MKKQSLRLPLPMLLLLLFLLRPECSWGQPNKISVNYKNVPLEEVIRDITKKSGYKFFYNNVQMNQGKEVTYSAENTSVGELLDQIFKGTALSYKFVNGHIVLRQENAAGGAQQKQVKQTGLTIEVRDARENTPIAGVVCQLADLGIYAVTDADGVANFSKIPAQEHILDVQMLGYEKYTAGVDATQLKTIRVKLEQTSLALEEVSVVATRNRNSLATVSEINRQALDHAQAVSLRDVIEFLPGQALTSGKTMTGVEQLSFRTLQADKNNSFGAAVIIDGVPVSNNATMEQQGGTLASTAGQGVDLRAIATDNIESVELIRGVPSAEYGDLTSGAIVVKSKVGRTPLDVRYKINPGIMQGSVSKGFGLGKNNRVLNVNADYLNASGDPRQKNSSVDRVNAGLSYAFTGRNKWQNTTRFTFSGILSKSANNDPESVADGKYNENKDYSFKISHELRIPLNYKLSRSISFNAGFTYKVAETRQRNIVSTGQNLYPLIDARESGIYEAVILPNSYEAIGGTRSKPISVFTKLSNNFFVNTKSLKQRFNMGVEYRYDKNLGTGIYNEDPLRPLSPANTRSRAFNDVPGLHQFSAFLEDNVDLTLGTQRIKLQAGLRFTSLQIGRPEGVYSLSPRINFSYSPLKWMDLRASFGLNAKTPGITHLYPDDRYSDHIVVRYTPNAESERLIMYQTNVNRLVSEGLKNSTTTRWGVGIDFRLPGGRMLSLEAYSDYNPSGFSSSPDYYGYYVRSYDVGYGITPVSGQKPLFNPSAPPKQTAIVYASKGLTGNNAVSRNRGVEFSMDLGRVKAINTSFYFTGAYMESAMWNTSPTYSNPVGGKLALGTTDTPQYKMAYEGGISRDIDRRFLTTLRVVYNIPAVRVVASAAAQMIWYTYSITTNEDKVPLGYFRFEENEQGELVKRYTAITPEMLADKEYRIDGVLLRDQVSLAKDKRATVNPPLFLFNLRLTKEIGKVAGFSFYANNATYYQPWQHSNISGTRSERNPNLEFGFELSLKF